MGNYFDPQFTFAIDTDSHAGNFERSMCAFITGQVGDCGVGDDVAEQARPELDGTALDDDDLIAHVPDEHGCARPCSAEGNAVEIYFFKQPSDEAIALMMERAKFYGSTPFGRRGPKKTVKILGFRLFKQETVKTELGSWDP